MVRHGHYQTDRASENYGHLTKLGRKQALWAAKCLCEDSFDVAHVSSAVRTKETAECIFSCLPVERVKYSRFLLEGLPYFSVSKARKMGYSKEKVARDSERADKAFDKFFTPNLGKKVRNELIIGHGNMIRFFIARALKISPRKWVSLDILQCSLSIVEIDDGGEMRLISFNESGHIPKSSRTFL